MAREVTLVQPTGGMALTGRAFVAYGRASGVAGVRAVLRDVRKRLVAEGRTLHPPAGLSASLVSSPTTWVAYFAPLDLLPGLYLLEVSEVGVNIPASATRELRVEAPDEAVLTILSPSPGAILSGHQLVAHGTINQDQLVSATLYLPTAGGVVERRAAQAQGPPETPHWVVAFSDLPEVTGPARLEVTGGSATAGCEGIHLG